MAEREQEIRARLDRLVELYLAGDLAPERYHREKRLCYDRLADLHPNGYSAIIEAGQLLEQFEQVWLAGTHLAKKELLQFAVAAVLIRGKLVRAVQLTEAFYPFVPYRIGRNSGSDGCHRLVKTPFR